MSAEAVEPATRRNLAPKTIEAKKRALRLIQGGPALFVAVDRARQHIDDLRAQGMPVATIAAAAQISRQTIAPIAWPNHSDRIQTIRPATEAAILSVRCTAHELAAGLTVPSIGSVRRIQALMAIGWTQSSLAGRLGMQQRNLSDVIYKRPRIRSATAKAITVLYDELSMTSGPAARTRTHAARKGWAVPLSWDEDGIDDPQAQPAGRVRARSQRETRAVIQELAAEGLNRTAIARHLRCSGSTVRRALDDPEGYVR